MKHVKHGRWHRVLGIALFVVGCGAGPDEGAAHREDSGVAPEGTAPGGSDGSQDRTKSQPDAAPADDGLEPEGDERMPQPDAGAEEALPDGGAGVDGDDVEPVEAMLASVAPEETPMSCPTGHVGDACLECDLGYHDPDGDGTCLASCDGGGDVEPLDCGDAGVCEDEEGARRCECRPGYVGELCDECDEGMQDEDDNGTCKEACEGGGNVRPLDCGEHGACVDRAGERECNCDDGFTGPRCDGCNEGTQLVGAACEPTCEGGGAIEPLDCNFGTCEDPSVAGPRHCDCWTGYTGEQCDQCAVGYQDNDGNGTCSASCAGGGFLAPETCSGHGTCDDASGQKECACEQAYVGHACDQCAPGHRAADAPGECELDEPSQLGMKLWLDADHASSLGLDESYHAAYWKDRHDDAIKLQAGATNQRPKYVAQGMNGRPVLRFDTGDELGFEHWTGLINEARYTMFIVVDPSEQRLAYPIAGDFGDDEVHGFRTEIRPKIPSGNGGASYIPAFRHLHSALDSNVAVTRMIYLFEEDIPRVFVVRWSAAAQERFHYLAGNSRYGMTDHEQEYDLLSSEKVFGSEMRLRVGRDDDGTAHHMDLAEVILFDRVLDDGEMGAVLRYLHAKWLGGTPDGE